MQHLIYIFEIHGRNANYVAGNFLQWRRSLFACMPASLYNWLKSFRSPPFIYILSFHWLFFMLITTVSTTTAVNGRDVVSFTHEPSDTYSRYGLRTLTYVADIWRGRCYSYIALETRWNRCNQLCIISCCDKQVMNAKNTQLNNGGNVV